MRKLVVVLISVCIVAVAVGAVLFTLHYECPHEILPVKEPEKKEEAPAEEKEEKKALTVGIGVEDITIHRGGKDLRAVLAYREQKENRPLVIIIGDWYLFGGDTHEYSNWAIYFAENGYTVMLLEPENFSDPFLPLSQTELWAEDIRHAVDWAAENLNFSSLGIFAHGLGANAAMRYCSGPKKVDALVVLSGGSPASVRDLKVPLQVFTGDFDILSYGAWLLSTPLYYPARPPKEIIAISAGTHWGMSDFIDAFMPEPDWEKKVIEHYSLAWFDYYLKKDRSALKRITAPIEGLSPIIPSLYDLGPGEYQIAGGKKFFEDPVDNLQKAFRSAPEALRPLTRNIIDVCTNRDYISSVIQPFCWSVTEFLLYFVTNMLTYCIPGGAL